MYDENRCLTKETRAWITDDAPKSLKTISLDKVVRSLDKLKTLDTLLPSCHTIWFDLIQRYLADRPVSDTQDSIDRYNFLLGKMTW